MVHCAKLVLTLCSLLSSQKYQLWLQSIVGENQTVGIWIIGWFLSAKIKFSKAEGKAPTIGKKKVYFMSDSNVTKVRRDETKNCRVAVKSLLSRCHLARKPLDK